jgi:hypothetical protein
MDNQEKILKLKELLLADATEFHENMKALTEKIRELSSTIKSEKKKIYPRYKWFLTEYSLDWISDIVDVVANCREISKKILVQQDYLEKLEEDISQKTTVEEEFQQSLNHEDEEQEQTIEVLSEKKPFETEADRQAIRVGKEASEQLEEPEESEEEESDDEDESEEEESEEPEPEPVTEDNIQEAEEVEKKKPYKKQKTSKDTEQYMNDLADYQKTLKKELAGMPRTVTRKLTAKEIKEREERYKDG